MINAQFSQLESKFLGVYQANHLHLLAPSLYTKHYFSGTSATLCVSKENLKRHEGSKSDTIEEFYVEEFVFNETKMAKTILGEGQTENIIITSDNSTEDLQTVCIVI